MAARPSAGAVTEEGTPPEDAVVSLAEAEAGPASAAADTEKPDGGAAAAAAETEISVTAPPAETELTLTKDEGVRISSLRKGSLFAHILLEFFSHFSARFILAFGG
jgi:hypothetical protein